MRCAVAVAECLAKDRPDWELAAGRLCKAVAHHPGAFALKVEFAMDWYYPMLSGALEGEAGRRRIAEGWSTFVMEGLGVRPVLSTGDWVTAGGDGGMRADARRPRYGGTPPWTSSRLGRTCGCRTVRTGPASSTQNGRPSPRTSARPTPSLPWCWRRMRLSNATPAAGSSGVKEACRPHSTWPSRIAGTPLRGAPSPIRCSDSPGLTRSPRPTDTGIASRAAGVRDAMRQRQGRPRQSDFRPAPRVFVRQRGDVIRRRTQAAARTVVDELARLERVTVQIVGRAPALPAGSGNTLRSPASPRTLRAVPSRGSPPRRVRRHVHRR